MVRRIKTWFCCQMDLGLCVACPCSPLLPSCTHWVTTMVALILLSSWYCDPPFVLFIYVTGSPDLELVILLPSRCQDYTVHSLWGSENWTQSFMHARQVPYQLSYPYLDEFLFPWLISSMRSGECLFSLATVSSILSPALVIQEVVSWYVYRWTSQALTNSFPH